MDVEDNRPQIIMLYVGDVFGDISYNDKILLGASEAAEKEDLKLVDLYIDDESISESLVKTLVNSTINELNSSNYKTLVIIPNVNGVEWLKDNLVLKNKSENLTIVVLESRDSMANATSVFLPMYGASFMAGKAMREVYPERDSLLVLKANDITPTLKDISQGFIDGMNSANANGLFIQQQILSDGEDGFNMSDSLYLRSYDYNHNYNMILPACGHSVQGLLRFNRENPTSFYTIGVDIDMEPYSNRVPLSIVKNMETLTYDLICKWKKGTTFPQHLNYGIESGYVGVTCSSAYKSVLNKRLNELKTEGISKEKEYEAGR